MQSRLEQLRQEPNLKAKISSILEVNFINYDKIADILASAIYSKQNVILYGPGGHGKSEMVECVLENLGLWDRQDPIKSETLVQSFGEGLTEDMLWGGIDFRKLNCPTNPEMWFNVENSFLKYPVAVFEELFDAPAFCLLPLKHTLQAGFLAKNGKSYPMQTELIIACTNRNPEEIAEMGETYRALLERFVLRKEVEWDSYTTDDYSNLISKHKYARHFDNQDVMRALASLMSDCYEAGHFISPRTAMKAVDVVYGRARSRNSLYIQTEDFAALTHVTGFAPLVGKFITQAQNKIKELKSREVINELLERYMEVEKTANSGLCSKVIDWCVLAKKAHDIAKMLASIEAPDSMYNTVQEYISSLNQKSLHYLVQARDMTAIV